jgi:hypothetical protein
VGGHVPPAQKFHALLGHDDLHHLFGLGPAQTVLREEEHAHAVVALSAQLYLLNQRGPLHKLVGHLYHDAHAVAGLARRVLAGPVLQLLHDLQGAVHRLTRLCAAEIHHRPYAAGVVLPVRRAAVEYPLSFLFRAHMLNLPAENSLRKCKAGPPRQKGAHLLALLDYRPLFSRMSTQICVLSNAALHFHHKLQNRKPG